MHCIVMAGSSDYYYTNLLNSNDQNTLNGSVTVNVPHQLKMNAEAVEQIIAFCYTGAIELNIENIESVLTAAKELEIKPLKLICTDMLEKMLDTTNCIRFLEIACKHSLQIVKKKALEILSTELQFFNRPETYGYLVDAVHMAENAAMNSGNYCEGTRSAFCAAVNPLIFFLFSIRTGRFIVSDSLLLVSLKATSLDQHKGTQSNNQTIRT